MYSCMSCSRSIFLNRRTVLSAKDITIGEDYCQFGVIISRGLKIKVNVVKEMADGWLEIYDSCL